MRLEELSEMGDLGEFQKILNTQYNNILKQYSLGLYIATQLSRIIKIWKPLSWTVSLKTERIGRLWEWNIIIDKLMKILDGILNDQYALLNCLFFCSSHPNSARI